MTTFAVSIVDIDDKKLKPFFIDFQNKQWLYRIKHASIKKELVAKAMGFKPSLNPTILDATAGLGKDSFILAACGFKVTMLERSSLIYLLLQDALQRAEDDPFLQRITSALHLINADAIAWLKARNFTVPPDVIYLDPMFPEKQKSAAVKKDMVILQKLLGNDTDSEQLLEMALTCARRRVVVKRPRLATNIANKEPNLIIEGTSSRFDIYLV